MGSDRRDERARSPAATRPASGTCTTRRVGGRRRSRTPPTPVSGVCRGPHGFEREALHRALVHVVQHAGRSPGISRCAFAVSWRWIATSSSASQSRSSSPASMSSTSCCSARKWSHVDARRARAGSPRSCRSSRSSATARSSAEVGVVVDLAAELGRVGEQADLAQPRDELGVEPGPLDRARRACSCGPAAAKRPSRPGRSTSTIARIAASENRWRLELADPVEPLEVLGAVEPVPARPLRAARAGPRGRSTGSCRR